jgi:hypothetical protein
VISASLVMRPVQAFAQTPAVAQALRDEIQQLRQDFEARLSALEARLAAIPQKGAEVVGTVPPPSPTPPVPVGAEAVGEFGGALPVYGTTGSAVSGGKVFNPDVAVVGNFLGIGGRNEVSPGRALEMHESEVSFQAVVDSYARADFFMAFGEEGVGLEEGFLTLTALPGGLLTKVGKMRAAFGKVNTLHTHRVPWADRPLVITNLVGGEEGIADAGVSVARLIPNPWMFLEATGQVFRGDAGDAIFRSSAASDLSYVGHLRGYHDISESTNVDLGLSYSRGHNPSGIVDGHDIGRFTTGLVGIDATYRWRPLRRSIYHSFIGRSEWIWSRRQQPNGLQRSTGGYVSGEYQVGRRWFAGARYDRANRADDQSLLDTGGSLIVTFLPSEFSQVRGQYRRTNYAGRPTANELLFQFQFLIGAHGAHAF